MPSGMFNLIPREVRFFDYFEQQGTNIIDTADLLYELVHTFSEARARVHVAGAQSSWPAPFASGETTKSLRRRSARRLRRDV